MFELTITPQTSADVEFERLTDEFTFLWYAFLAQWGPPVPRTGRSPDRVDHHVRLHVLMDAMAEIEALYEDTPPWDDFLDNLPGFQSYWSVQNKRHMAAHHER